MIWHSYCDSLFVTCLLGDGTGVPWQQCVIVRCLRLLSVLFYIRDPQSVLSVVYRPSNDRPRQVALGTQLLRTGLCFTGPESPTPNNLQRTCSCRGDVLCWSIKLKAVDLHVLQWKLRCHISGSMLYNIIISDRCHLHAKLGFATKLYRFRYET